MSDSSEHEKMIKKTNSIIRKNRTILKTASPLGKTTLRKEYLDMQGFDFRFFSSIFRTSSGNIYRLCYDYGYTNVADNKILIINYQSYMKRKPSFMEEIFLSEFFILKDIFPSVERNS